MEGLLIRIDVFVHEGPKPLINLTRARRDLEAEVWVVTFHRSNFLHGSRPEQHAGGRAVRVELACAVNDTALGGCHATPGVGHTRLAAHPPRLAPHTADAGELPP